MTSSSGRELRGSVSRWISVQLADLAGCWRLLQRIRRCCACLRSALGFTGDLIRCGCPFERLAKSLHCLEMWETKNMALSMERQFDTFVRDVKRSEAKDGLVRNCSALAALHPDEELSGPRASWDIASRVLGPALDFCFWSYSSARKCSQNLLSFGHKYGERRARTWYSLR